MLDLDIEIARPLTIFLLDLPDSRKQKLEGLQVYQVAVFFRLTTTLADVIGLKLPAEARYNPEAVPA